MAVRSVLKKMGLGYSSLELGWVDITDDLSSEQLKQFNSHLKYYELEILENKRKILAERIKTLIVEMLHSSESSGKFRFSEYVSRKLHYDYTYLSNIFSEIENSTIERFYIEQRIERSKELMVYEEMTVSGIAYELNFSSASHFCVQFKKITGLTPASFKRLSQSPEFIWRKVG